MARRSSADPRREAMGGLARGLTVTRGYTRERLAMLRRRP